MECIILAGGFGTRLSHVVPNLPKPMAPVAGRPFLEIILERLILKGFKRAILSVGYMADVIIRYFGHEFSGLKLEYAIEERPLGTGGAVRFAMEKSQNDHIFVFNGDTFLDLEVSHVEAMWQAHRRPIIVGSIVTDTSRYGRLLSTKGRVIGFSEKRTEGAGLINAGCYVLNEAQFASFNSMRTFSLETDYLARTVSTSWFDLFVTQGMFIDIGVAEDYYRAQTELVCLAVQGGVCYPP